MVAVVAVVAVAAVVVVAAFLVVKAAVPPPASSAGVRHLAACLAAAAQQFSPQYSDPVAVLALQLRALVCRRRHQQNWGQRVLGPRQHSAPLLHSVRRLHLVRHQRLAQLQPSVVRQPSAQVEGPHSAWLEPRVQWPHLARPIPRPPLDPWLAVAAGVVVVSAPLAVAADSVLAATVVAHRLVHLRRERSLARGANSKIFVLCALKPTK